MSSYKTLTQLGWKPFFQQQLTIEEWETHHPTRIVEYHKSRIELLGEIGRFSVELTPNMPTMTVGDWILLDSNNHFFRLLERFSCFRRFSSGTSASEQLIAANVDTTFILCSINDDFNLNRIERFLSISNEAEVEPVILLSKVDLNRSEAKHYLNAIKQANSQVDAFAIDCRDRNSVMQLEPWLKQGKTIVLLGSSGVGKSTLTNTLVGETEQRTGEIRIHDSKGRHTTTRRSLFTLSSGAVIMDTPGMREIQLPNCQSGLSITFSEIEALAKRCRFNDCQHTNEPGCQVLKAVKEGNIDERRLSHYQKLLREHAQNSASLAERRASDKNLGRFYKQAKKEAKNFKRGS